MSVQAGGEARWGEHGIVEKGAGTRYARTVRWHFIPIARHGASAVRKRASCGRRRGSDSSVCSHGSRQSAACCRVAWKYAVIFAAPAPPGAPRRHRRALSFATRSLPLYQWAVGQVPRQKHARRRGGRQALIYMGEENARAVGAVLQAAVRVGEGV